MARGHFELTSLWKKNVPMLPDLNDYDTTHVCAPHPKMSESAWRAIYQEAWALYYSPEHMVRARTSCLARGYIEVSAPMPERGSKLSSPPPWAGGNGQPQYGYMDANGVFQPFTIVPQ